MNRFFTFLILSLFAFACGKSDQQRVDNPCGARDTLFARIDSLEHTLETSSTNWIVVDQQVKEVFSRLDKNLRQADWACNYLNHEFRPQKDRFHFLVLLSEAAVRDTVPDIMYYLVRARSIFGEDPEISEYLSEEMAHIAYANPIAYLTYLQAHPSLEDMLLNSTKWNSTTLPVIISRFEAFEAGSGPARFLKEKFSRDQEDEEL